MIRSLVRSALGMLASIVLAAPALAANSFFATADVQDFDNGCGELTGGGGRSSAPISAGFACPSGSAAAFATPGHVGATSRVVGNAIVGAGAEFDTFVTFLPVDGQDGDVIPVQLNLAFGGSMAVAGSAQASYNLLVEFGRDFVRSTGILGNDNLPSHGDMTLGFSEGGEIDNNDSVFVGGVLTTGTVMVPVGIPVGIVISLGTGGFGNPGSMNTAFAHSVDFVRDRPLFNLPDGYTAEDPDAFVFDNQFRPPSGAPEPAEWALLIAGFGLTGAVLRRRAGLA